jgi:very-short-patch-repair endonuclease
MYDEGRSRELGRHGIQVIRFKNSEILRNPLEILTKIKKVISDLASPSLLGEGDNRG